jgi:hypothetical protein
VAIVHPGWQLPSPLKIRYSLLTVTVLGGGDGGGGGLGGGGGDDGGGEAASINSMKKWVGAGRRISERFSAFNLILGSISYPATLHTTQNGVRCKLRSCTSLDQINVAS